jgi:hypothetical protein
MNVYHDSEDSDHGIAYAFVSDSNEEDNHQQNDADLLHVLILFITLTEEGNKRSPEFRD